MFCPITLFQDVRFEKFLHKQGSFFEVKHFEYQQSYDILKIEHFISYFCLSLLFALCLYKPYFLLFKYNFDSHEWQFRTTVLGKLRDFFKDEIDMCSCSVLLVNSIFCCELHFLAFSCICQIYVAEVLIIHFYNYYHLRFLSPYEYQSEVKFLRGQLQIWIQLHIHIWVVTFDLNLGPTPSLAPVPSVSHLRTCWEVNSGSGSRSIFVLYLLRFCFISSSSPTYVSP